MHSPLPHGLLDSPHQTPNISTTLLSRHYPPSPDQIIRIPRKQCLSIRAPRQTHTLGLPALLTYGRIFGLQLVNLALLLEIEDDDGARRRGAEPVSVRGEDEGVDFVTGGQRVEVLGLVEVPEHGCAVFAAGGTEGAVGGDGHGVDVAGVADVVGLDAAIGEFPYLREEEIVSAVINLLQIFAQLEDSFPSRCCHQCVGDGSCKVQSII